MAEVYPRVYGATSSQPVRTPWIGGLSPCVRGYLRVFGVERTYGGSIPVCTGLPSDLNARALRLWVYPRVYGATRG